MRSRLKRKIPAFGVALVASLAFAGIAAGNASALSFSWEGGYVATFNTTAPDVLFLTSNGYNAVRCEGTSVAALGGTSTWTESAKGNVQFSLKNCNYRLGSTNLPCTSAGQSSGRIVTNVLSVKPVYLDAAKTKYGLQIGNPGNTWAEFNCTAFFPSVKWTGSILTQITSPALNVTATAFSVTASGSQGKQTYEQVEGTGPSQHLNQTIGETTEPAGVASTMTWTLVGQKGKFIP